MTKQDTGTMVIRFVDGTEEVLEFARPPQDDVNLVGHIQEGLNAQHLIVEADGKLLVYPFHNIKAIEVSPLPEKLPRVTLKKARLVS